MKIWIVLFVIPLIVCQKASNAINTLDPATCPPLLDLIFVMDTSGSIEEVYKEHVRWTVSIVDSLPIHHDAVRIAAIQYAESPIIEFSLNTYTEKDDVVKHLDGIEFQSGVTKSGAALRSAEQEIFSKEKGGRDNATKILVIFTDGLSIDDPIKPSNQLRQKGAKLYVISVGTDGFVPEMQRIAGEVENVYGPPDLERLKDQLLSDVEAKTTKATPVVPSTTSTVVRTTLAPVEITTTTIKSTEPTTTTTKLSTTTSSTITLPSSSTTSSTTTTTSIEPTTITPSTTAAQKKKSSTTFATLIPRNVSIPMMSGELRTEISATPRKIKRIKKIRKIVRRKHKLFGTGKDVKAELSQAKNKVVRRVKKITRKITPDETIEEKSTSTTRVITRKTTTTPQITTTAVTPEVITDAPTTRRTFRIIKKKLRTPESTTSTTTTTTTIPTTTTKSTFRKISRATITRRPTTSATTETTTTTTTRTPTTQKHLNRAFAVKNRGVGLSQQCPLDILFVVDSSGSVQGIYEKQKEFLSSLLSSIDPAAQSHRVGLIQFAGQHLQKMEWTFDSYSQNDQIMKAFSGVRHFTGTTYIGAALRLAVTQLETRRTEVPTIVVLLSDGFSQDDATEPASQIKLMSNVETFAVSLAELNNMSFLNQFAGATSNVFVGDDVPALKTKLVDRFNCVI